MQDKEKLKPKDILEKRLGKLRYMNIACILFGLTALINNAVASTDKKWYEQHPNYWSGCWGGGLIILSAVVSMVADSKTKKQLFALSIFFAVLGLLSAIAMTVFAGFGIEKDIKRRQGVNRPMCIIIAICGLLGFIVEIIAMVEMGRILRLPAEVWEKEDLGYGKPSHEINPGKNSRKNGGNSGVHTPSQRRPHPLYPSQASDDVKSSYNQADTEAGSYVITQEMWAPRPVRRANSRPYTPGMGEVYTLTPFQGSTGRLGGYTAHTGRHGAYPGREAGHPRRGAGYPGREAGYPVGDEDYPVGLGVGPGVRDDDDGLPGVHNRMSALASSQLRQIALETSPPTLTAHRAHGASKIHQENRKLGQWSPPPSYTNLNYSAEEKIESTHF